MDQFQVSHQLHHMDVDQIFGDIEYQLNIYHIC